jgi:glycine/D-amino acid oxidase-like deaminating enzyme
MLKLPDKEESLLRPGKVKPSCPELKEDIEVDTVVIGGGITGITTAYLLKQAGQKVAVTEKATIGSGTTGHTTGKVTSQHNLIYAELSERLGAQKARIYAQANQTAVEQIDRIIKAERIDCGWERADNYVFTTQRRRVREFKQEAKIAAGLGLPASFETTSPLPFKITGAVKFTGQAHFSAQKYIKALAAKINKAGSRVYENTRAIGIRDGSPAIVKTINGRVVAKNIVVATNVPTFPLLARGLYCALEYPHTSYIVAGRPKIKLSGMYISPDKNHYSILPVGKGKEQIVLIGGQNHIRGHGRAAPNYQKLAGYAEVKFGVKSISYKWKAWDYMAYDNVPLIGKLYPWSKHLYVASAFKKWGLAHSMVAAMILRDSITGQPNEWADLYSPQRLSPITSIPHVIANSLG